MFLEVMKVYLEVMKVYLEVNVEKADAENTKSEFQREIWLARKTTRTHQREKFY